MKISAIIFDMDGVVMDSMHMWSHLASDYLLEMGKTPDPQINQRMQAKSIGEAAKLLAAEYDMDKTPEQVVSDILNRINDFYMYESELKPGAQDGLDSISRAGIGMCMATSTNRHLAEAALARCGVLDHFEFVLTSAEIGGGKDRPDIFLEAQKKFEMPANEILVVEDSPVAIDTANAAGFRTCGVRDENQMEIFGELGDAADIVVDSIRELKSLLFG